MAADLPVPVLRDADQVQVIRQQLPGLATMRHLRGKAGLAEVCHHWHGARPSIPSCSTCLDTCRSLTALATISSWPPCLTVQPSWTQPSCSLVQALGKCFVPCIDTPSCAAGNETCPQPQTSEHLAAIEIMKLKHILILQNKIDLVKEAEATDQYQQILSFVKGE